MSERYFLKIDGLNGGSIDPLHMGAFEVESFWIKPPREQVGGGSVGGNDSRATDAVFTKRTDARSSILVHAASNGTVFKNATLTIDKETFIGLRIPTVVLRMHSVMVDVVHPRHGFDEITLNFDRIRFEKGGLGSIPNQDPKQSWGPYGVRGS